jgi:hypothetical protein
MSDDPDGTFLQDKESHALHNLLKDVIEPVKKLMHKHTGNATEKKAINKEKGDMLHEDYNLFFEKQDKWINEIAKKHSKKPEYVCCILLCAPQGSQQAPSLYNALIHAKGKELNKGMVVQLQ